MLLCALIADLLRILSDGERHGVMLAEPFSFTAFFISLALSAASYGLQRIFGPKPPKQVRGQMTGDLFIQNAEMGNPVTEIYGAAPGQTTRSATWTNLTKAFINDDGDLQNDNTGSDNCFTDASGTGDAGAWAVQTIDSGDFEISWKFAKEGGGAAGRSFVGLTSGAFSLNFATYDYAIHLSTENNTVDPFPPNTVFVYEDGPPRKAVSSGSWVEGSTYRISCVGGVVKYYEKTTLLYTSLTAPTYPMHVAVSMACHDSIIQDLTIATPSVDNKGGIKTAGTIIWCKAPRKVVTKEKKGGKGAPKQTIETITYYTDVAILFARGRQRLKKLWANADLIVDIDAGVNKATGLIDPGSTDTTTYSQGMPPSGQGALAVFSWAARQDGSISGTVGGGGGASMRWYEGNYDQLPDPVIEADVGAGNCPAFRGYAYLVIENFNISKYGSIPTFLATIENMDYVDLEQIADHLCERVGIEPQDKNFSEFSGQAVRGLIVKQPTAPRTTLETAAMPYAAQFFEAVDGLLTGNFLGSSPVITLDENDLGMVEGDVTSVLGEMGEKVIHTIVDEVQVPREMAVTAYDPLKDHETTTQSAYRMVGFARAIEQVSMPMALTPDETRQTAERLLYQRHTERESASTKLPSKYCWIDPGTVFTIIDDGLEYNLRLGQASGSVPGLIEFQAVQDEIEVYSQTIAGDGGNGYKPPTVKAPVASVAFLLDTVMLRDADNKAGYYAAVAPQSSSGGWPGAALYRDRGAGYEQVETFLVPAIAGTLVNAVTPPADQAVWDEATTVTIDLYSKDDTLESMTELQVLNGANAANLGLDQIIQYKTATQVVGFDSRWELTGLLWGRRGSDYATALIPAGSRFVVLDSAMVFIENELSERGIERNFKAVSSGFSVADTPATAFNWDAGPLKPLSVVHVEGLRDGGNNLTITWTRRSRVAQEAPYAGASLPLGEETEQYEIAVMDGVTEKRVLTATSETVVYTAAMAATDGLAPTGPVTFRLYQMSALVGRGHVREVVL